MRREGWACWEGTLCGLVSWRCGDSGRLGIGMAFGNGINQPGTALVTAGLGVEESTTEYRDRIA